MLKTSKSDIIEPSFFYILSYYYTRLKSRRISYVKISCFAIVIALALFEITEVKLIGQGGMTTYADVIDFNIKAYAVLRDFLALPYGYMVMNFENFSRYVEMSNSKFRLGTSMFRPLLSLFMQAYIADELSSEIDLHEITPAANVGTFLRDLYVEGGVLICLIGAFWNALLMRWVHSRFRRRQDDISMVVYVVLLYPWLTIFFTNAFSVLTTYSNLFFAVVILFASHTHKNKKFLFLKSDLTKGKKVCVKH